MDGSGQHRDCPKVSIYGHALSILQKAGRVFELEDGGDADLTGDDRLMRQEIPLFHHNSRGERKQRHPTGIRERCDEDLSAQKFTRPGQIVDHACDSRHASAAATDTGVFIGLPVGQFASRRGRLSEQPWS